MIHAAIWNIPSLFMAVKLANTKVEMRGMNIVILVFVDQY